MTDLPWNTPLFDVMADAPRNQAGTKRPPLTVVCSEGRRQRFLRGMVTHDLILRGLDFDRAYSVARAIRDKISDRETVTTSEIRDLIEEQLQSVFGAELPATLRAPIKPEPAATVLHEGQRQPFSRGLVASSLRAAGIDGDRAYRLVTELEADLRAEEVRVIDSGGLALRVGELLEQHEGVEAARGYRLMRQLRRLPRPLIVYLGGASGTGKSTLAIELAPLLEIHRISSTDTIRQVMRMVFTPAILPAIHASSFEVPAGQDLVEPLTSPGDPNYEERLQTAFEEQAVRVAVGVRAVVERAIVENVNLIVEGVHVHPGLMPFSDLEGGAFQVPLVLGTLDGEAHRSRFLSRARSSGREAGRYLDSFEPIRTLHEHLLQLAEERDLPILDTSSGEPAAASAIRLVTEMLVHQWPDFARPDSASRHEPVPTLLLVIDGLPDRPVRALGGRTPLSAARTPTLDRLAREGQTGLADPIAPGVTADTAAGTLALFGQSPLAMRRGPIEALGSEIGLRPGDIALRGNLATVNDQGEIIDRRAGRIRGDDAIDLAKAIDRLPLPGSDIEVRVAPATEHRLAIILRGNGLSSAFQGSDPGDGAPLGPPLTPTPEEPHNEQAVHAARSLALFERKARRALAKHRVNKRRESEGLSPANCVLTRGAGRLHRLTRLEESGLPLRLACVSGDRTVLGIARWLGGEVISRPGMTANLDTDLKAKVDASFDALDRNDLVVLHVKGADIASHDMRPDLKASFLERLDEVLGERLEQHQGPLRIAVASDHGTLSESGQHAADPAPVLIWGTGLDADDVESFEELTVQQGALERFPLQLLLSRLYQLS